LIEDFIDIGVEILNPVQPLAAGMDSFGLKKRFVDQLSFHGGIDLQEALPGSKDDVRKEVETRIEAFGPGGGYILGPANHIQNDTPAENVILLYQYAREYGTYPLKGSV
jgi:uroporphyrinogen decarboxylase